MVIFDRSETCAAIQKIAATVSPDDLKQGLRYINKKGLDKTIAAWATTIVSGCLAAPRAKSKPPKPSPETWQSNGVRTVKLLPKEDLLEGCIGKEKMKKVGEG